MAFNPLASLQQGLDLRQGMQDRERQNQLNQLRGAISQQAGQAGFNPNQSLELQQLAALDPTGAAQSAAVFNQLDERRKKAFFEDAREGRRALESGNSGKFLDIISNRLDSLEKIGGDPSDTQAVLNSFASGDIAGTIQQLAAVEQGGIELGFLSDPQSRAREQEARKTASQKDFDTFQRLIEEDPEKAKQFGRKAGFIRESEQEKSDIKVTETERKAIAKANAKRKQGFIDSGIVAADSAANVKRALTLLDEVKTGGFDNLALKAKRLFGVEGANEGELSNLMGKAVLAQLKPIFGAAFTAKEGEALTAIEAGFGKSTANNKRLLENALKIIDRAARRGIAAAEDQEDAFTADEIRNSLAFDVRDKVIPIEEAPQQQTQAPQVINWSDL